MFSLEQIAAAHSKVKSGADFPAYIQSLRKLGVISYEVFVRDGKTSYTGKGDFKISGLAKYNPLSIAEKSHKEQFKADLLAHQQGKTDYPTFCQDCAKSGVEKWVVNLEKMTCTYFDKAENELLIESIPS